MKRDEKNRSLFILSKERHSGTLFVALGLMEILKRSYKRVAFFKPIVKNCLVDEDIETIISLFDLSQKESEACGVTLKEAQAFLLKNEEERLYEVIIDRYESLKEEYDFVLCAGFEGETLQEAVDFDLNLKIAKNLSSPVAGVVSAFGRSLKDAQEETILWRNMMREEGVEPLAFFINRVEESLSCSIFRIGEEESVPCFPIPYEPELDRPTVLDLLKSGRFEILMTKSEKELQRSIKGVLIAAMRPENFLKRLKEGDLIVVPADRDDILLAIYSANHSPAFAAASAVVVTGDLKISPEIERLLTSDANFRIALLHSSEDTMESAMAIDKVEAGLSPEHHRKVDLALGHFANYVDSSLIEESLQKSDIKIVTPAMFLHRIYAAAASDKRRIVLPESNDERILQAAETVLRRGIAEITLLGKREEILNRAGILGVDLAKADFVDPKTSGYMDRFIERLYRLRRKKGITLEDAASMMENFTYFATMMVYEGIADGMVSGATHTTRETVLPALQIIKTKPGIDIVSSIFFICLETRVLVYGDCAIVPDPTPKELAQIAISSADTAKAFDIDPVVALLSYSTGESGVGKDVEKVREAAQIAKEMRPDLLLEGPMQYDAAIDPEVAARKMPHSRVAGRATVFIFPDLNTGNNTYKAVQRSTGAVAIGPILQGLKKPVNDLSRGCSVDDIVSTVAITAIEAARL
ncbi:MAG: phosphate acetyltransferase [Hydrogenimonas sp.]|nr:phosphate acetyltransferase [Hydrogenimonas sp.]